MDPSPGALLGLAVLGFVPGALLYRALRPSGSRLEYAALAPTLSFAFVFVFGELAALVRLPFAPVPFLILVSVTAVVATLRSRRTRPTALRTPSRRLSVQPATMLLLAAITLSGLSWLFGLHGLATTPPYTDSVNHGVMAAQVSRLESLDPGRVLSSDALDPSASSTETAFYPLALHGQVALAERLFGVEIADGLLAATLLFSVFVLPVGLFFMARALVPENPMVAGLSALLSASIGFVPILPMSFGGLPLIIGLAMVPAVAVIAGRYVIGGGAPSEAAVAALGTVGILATHTSEIPLLAIMLGCIALEALLRKRQSLAGLLQRSAVLGGMSVLLVAPTIPALVGGTAERSGIDERDPGSFVHALSELLGIVGFQRGVDVLGVLAVIGMVLCVKHRRHLTVVGTAAVMLFLYFLAACQEGPLNILTTPWYQHPGRIALNFVLLVPFLAALALTDLGPALNRALHRDHPGRDFNPAVAVSLVLAVAGLFLNSTSLRTLFQERAVVGPDARAAFSYLKEHVEPGERVLNDGNTDGAMWMFPFEGVVPVMGLQPARPGASWEERLWLVRNLPDLPANPKVKELLDKYNVRFMYFDDRNFELNTHHVSGEALGQTPSVCERFRSGSVRVFELAPDEACA